MLLSSGLSRTAQKARSTSVLVLNLILDSTTTLYHLKLVFRLRTTKHGTGRLNLETCGELCRCSPRQLPERQQLLTVVVQK